ncbi:MAG: putative glycoside hydrolase [Huintestinicola sp.]
MNKYRRKKIFRPKRHYKIKRRNDNVIKIVTGVIALGVLVFVGYSVAGPVSNYIADRAKQTDSEPWTPSVQSDSGTDISSESVPEQTSEGAVTENSLPEEAAPDVSQTVANEESASEAPAVTEGTQAVNIELRTGGAAASVSSEDMLSRESLADAMENIRNDGYAAVILPMKTEGGYFNYATDIDFVKTVIDGDDPVLSELTAKEIADMAQANGLRPVAMVSVLYDNNRYGDYRDGSYRSLDDSTWLDTSPEKGGKPWLSPFDEAAQDYLCDIMRELGNSGFGEIICDDFIFPEFRSTDIELLGEDVSPYSDRYLALTGLASMMTEAGKETGAEVMLRITANSVIKGYSELFYPEELNGCTILIDYSEDNISRTMVADGTEIILDEMSEYEKVTAVFSSVSAKAEGMGSYPLLDRESMSADEFDEAVRAVTALGYDKYFIY